MRGDVLEGEALLKRLGQHPDQVQELREEVARKLKCKPDEVLGVLRSMERRRSQYLDEALERLEEAQIARGDRGAYVWL